VRDARDQHRRERGEREGEGGAARDHGASRLPPFPGRVFPKVTQECVTA
jgi:hypothetical protein